MTNKEANNDERCNEHCDGVRSCFIQARILRSLIPNLRKGIVALIPSRVLQKSARIEVGIDERKTAEFLLIDVDLIVWILRC